MIEAKGLTAQRVTKTLIDSKILGKDIIKTETPQGAKIFIGVYTMNTGFTVVGQPVVVEAPYNENPTPLSHAKEIISYQTHTGTTLRFAYKEYISGLLVIGKPSASVCPENDDEEIGTTVAINNCKASIKSGHLIKPASGLTIEEAEKLAYENAYSAIWELEGYLLAHNLEQQKMNKHLAE